MIGRCGLATDSALTLRSSLVEWEDLDYAGYLLARALGLFPEEDFGGDIKWIFLIDNPLGSALDRMLGILVEVGILDYRDEPDGPQFRWCVSGNGDYLAKAR